MVLKLRSLELQSGEEVGIGPQGRSHRRQGPRRGTVRPEQGGHFGQRRRSPRSRRGLRELGIFVVPCGELERFHPGVSGENKAEWLRTVLETGRYENSAAARDFVLAAAEFISRHQ